MSDPRPSPAGGVVRWDRRLAAWAGSRDPDLAATKRATRAAVVVPSVFAVAVALSADVNVQLFAAFGAFALLLFVDFPGSPWTQLRSLGTLLLVGAAFITLGTLCSPHPAAAVAAMAVVGLAVLFAGVLSPQVTAATMAALLTFVLPVAVAAPPGQIPARLVGWLLAGALAIPAIMLLWPRPFRDELRRRLSSTARSLGTLVLAHATGHLDPRALQDAQAELAALRHQFESTTFPPTGAGPGDAAVAKLVGRMEWVGTNAVLGHQQAITLGLPEVRGVNRAVARVLSAAADLIGDRLGRPVRDPATAAELTAAVTDLEAQRNHSQTVSLGRLLDGTAEERAAAALASTEPIGGPRWTGPAERAGETGETVEPPPARLEGSRNEHRDRLLEVLDPTFRTRALGFAAEMVAQATSEAAGLGRPAGPGGRRRERAVWGSGRRVAVSHFNLRSVWLRNSLRGAVGLALAVAVVEVTNVNHGFWVVLGALSVLRSNAVGTGATALRALAGTVAGFAVGSAIMVGVANHDGPLWAILPLAVLVSGVAPAAISFAAGQAGFTVVVVVLFNIIDPTGWTVGLTRIEDVGIGCAVSLVVGLLFWPRGATAALGRALGDAYAAGSAYLFRAVQRTTSAHDDLDTQPARLASDAAYDRLDDAFRQYLSERGPKPVDHQTACNLMTGAVRTRVAAYSLATLSPRPVRPDEVVLESVTAAGDSLLRSSAEAHQWYLQAGEVLAGRVGTVPAPGRHEAALHELLVGAFLESSRDRRAGAVRAVLRMLWADESLEDELALQGELAGAISRFAGRRRRPDR